MDDHGDSCRAKLPDCFFKTGKRVAAADPCSRFRMDRLQPKFYPDGFFGIQFTKKLNFSGSKQSGRVATERATMSSRSMAQVNNVFNLAAGAYVFVKD